MRLPHRHIFDQHCELRHELPRFRLAGRHLCHRQRTVELYTDDSMGWDHGPGCRVDDREVVGAHPMTTSHTRQMRRVCCASNGLRGVIESCRGAALVEAAIILPFFVTIPLGILETGLLM